MSGRRAALLVVGLAGFSLGWSAPTVSDVKAVPAQVKTKKTPTAIEWRVTPGTVEVFVDGKRLGTAQELGRTRHRPGRHTIVLKRRGDEEEFEVKLVRGLTLRLEYSFNE